MISYQYLDGNDWEAEYFIPENQYFRWKGVPRVLFNMIRNSAISSGFIHGEVSPGSMTGTVPGCDRTFLLENSLCPDPYDARNLEMTSYAENYSWGFRKRFTLPADWQGKRLQLDFKGLDYQCRIFFNGEFLGNHTGMFMPCSCDISRFARFDGENLLAVVFEAAPKGLPDHHDHEPADFAYFHRTQIGFGWDWSRGFVPTGIYDSVVITAYDNAFITDKQLLFDGKSATVKLGIEARAGMTMPVKLRLIPDNFEGKCSETVLNAELKPGENSFDIAIPLPEDLQLWYPVGYGSQPLYRLEITMDDAVTTIKTGFKTVTMSRNPESPRGAADLTYVINGKPVFVRGVNYVPADLMISRVTPADYEHLVALAAAAGINYFRIWGGGVLEKDSFFDACDRYGIMVHQEFFHACSSSPKDPEFVAFKKREAVEVIKRLYNHVCLTLICGGNEMQYYGEIPDSPVLENYRAIAAVMVPQIPFRVSSPDLSRPGERHHGPWHYMEHAAWNKHFRNFASEVGCNAMPEFSSLKRFIPQREIEAMCGPALEYHFCHLANEFYDLKKPLKVFEYNGMEEFCKASMFAQGDAIQYIFEHYRRLYPEASGCIFWQYNEPWPTCSFNIVDYYGVPKQALYSMKRANAPVLLSLQDDSWCCQDNSLKAKWFITADSGFTGKVALKGVDCITGKELFSMEKSGTFAENTSLLAEINESLPDGITAVFCYIDGVCTNTRIYGVPDYKGAFALPRTTLDVRQDGKSISITNTGKSVAFNVKLEFPGLPDKSVIMSDNYLFIAPGETRIVEFTGDCGSAVLTATGWNC